MKLAIMTSRFLEHFVEAVLAESPASSEGIAIFAYDNFQTAAEQYQRLLPQADGILVTGSSIQAAIIKQFGKPPKPFIALDTDIQQCLELFLTLVDHNRSLDFSRVVVDMLLPIDERVTCRELLSTSSLEKYQELNKQYFDRLDLAQILELENAVVEKCRELWSARKIDLVICRLSSIIPALNELGIPNQYVYPGKKALIQALDSLRSIIELEQLHDSLPAVITIRLSSPAQDDDMDYNSAVLQQALLRFNKENLTDFMLQRTAKGFDIFTNVRTVGKLTQGYERCRLQEYLKQALSFDVSIGYGLGNDILEARRHADVAYRESVLHAGSFLTDEYGRNIGPMGREDLLTIREKVTPDLQQTAKAAKLSTLTIQKLWAIVDLLGTDEVTTQDIASRMGVTVRNANRILNNLAESGKAKVLYQHTNGTKGRPSKIYKLLLQP